MRTIVFGLLISLSLGLMAQPTFNESKGTNTATYAEAITFYTDLADRYDFVNIEDMGRSDQGKPIYLVIIGASELMDPAEKQMKVNFLINNAIHPGESCGVDASMKLALDLVKEENRPLLDKVNVLIVPIYNVGGALNRSCCTRANQDGPLEQGFRGNGQNLDLNRDFIKMDSYNTLAMAKIFSEWNPDVFFDNHTSNGADYPYAMTLLSTQHNKLGMEMGSFLKERIEPSLFRYMEEQGMPMSPYVMSKGRYPDEKGILGFYDSPRYGSGYGAIRNCFSFVPEAHMLKPYKVRVEATYQLMWGMLKFIDEEGMSLKEIRRIAIEEQQHMPEFPISWKMDTTVSRPLNFKGYTAEFKKSKVTGLEQLYYNRKKTFEKEIPFYDEFVVDQMVAAPMAYIIPQSWQKVIDKLAANGVMLNRLSKDVLLEVEQQKIEDYQTVSVPYEGHYMHYMTKTSRSNVKRQFYEGDYVLMLSQDLKRFLIETLEPEAPDSYFNWNFFDGVLMQKEYFSSYVFDKTAEKLLKEDSKLKADFEREKKEDVVFAKDARAQLDFIYKRSPYYEKSHMVYPVFGYRDEAGTLPLEPESVDLR